jgi:hypothetical protein
MIMRKIVRSPAQVLDAVREFVQSSGLCECGEDASTNPETLWKELPAHSGYHICKHGLVLSSKGRNIRAIKPFFNRYTKVLSVSFNGSTKSVAKLVLESFDPNFQRVGGVVRFKNMDHRDVRLSNLSYDAFGSEEEKQYWDSYYKVRWNSPAGVPEHLAKAFFSYVLDSSAVAKFCKEYNPENLPSTEELHVMLEKGYAGRADLRKYSQSGIPLGLAKHMLEYLAGETTSLHDVHSAFENPINQTESDATAEQKTASTNAVADVLVSDIDESPAKKMRMCGIPTTVAV